MMAFLPSIVFIALFLKWTPQVDISSKGDVDQYSREIPGGEYHSKPSFIRKIVQPSSIFSIIPTALQIFGTQAWR